MTNHNEDYYRLLNVAQDAPVDDIKKAYRKLALETHPDRNPGDPAAEERFKKVSEAYGVLADARKRAQYDQYRRLGIHQRPGGTPGGPGFGYSQDEIFRDFFGNRNAQDIFAEMRQEFERMGFRFDETFINKTFFGNRNVYFHGMFWSGPEGVRAYRTNWQSGGKTGTAPPEKPKGILQAGLSLIAGAGKKAGEWLIKKALTSAAKGLPGARQRSVPTSRSEDVVYQITVSAVEASRGATVEFELPHMENRQRVSVRIPPGVRSGSRLRLREMGRMGRGGARGDVYFQVRVG